MPSTGRPILIYQLQTDAAANGNGTPQRVGGFKTQQVEIQNGDPQVGGTMSGATGTCTCTLEGTYSTDAAITANTAIWHPVPYHLEDASGTRAVAGISIGANSATTVAVLSPFKYLRCRISAVAGTVKINVWFMGISE